MYRIKKFQLIEKREKTAKKIIHDNFGRRWENDNKYYKKNKFNNFNKNIKQKKIMCECETRQKKYFIFVRICSRVNAIMRIKDKTINCM